MNTYKIYKLNPNVVGLLEQYPEVKNQIINIEPKNVFFYEANGVFIWK
ncbi:hypothetical protein PM724_04355 [Erysipelatoclostridium ramosum]|nr:hypothetical protein [Thomasclavelia ramosa]MDB7093161.1 hypothetical protein [Thomasclavelia ramosa]